VLALAGAGMSTESGIPDYRGPQGSLRKRRPVRYQEFVRDAEARRRYWARSALGWPFMRQALPNKAHRALADLESFGILTGVLTQNVDGLHQRAGSRNVIELHGSLARVLCLSCGRSESRESLQARMLLMNPGWRQRLAEIAPDGDAELSPEVSLSFRVPACRNCDGVLKPDVVFFGENVPRRRVDRAWGMLDEADSLLVVGSSLTVYSGFRFVERAASQNKPVAIVNLGPTRGDHLASVKVEASLSDTLPPLAASLAPSS
jgi:NAD-dependent SIR2 family protein deacetylase